VSADQSPGGARWLVRFGYDGTGFDGWARQPGRRTVEGVLLRSLGNDAVRSRSPFVPPHIEVSSRTDRGVSARGNALVLVSPLGGPTLLRRLNAIDPEIFFLSAARVPHGFRVRDAVRRTYRYFELRPRGDPTSYAAAARHFAGQIDVRSFGRAIPPGHPCWRSIERVQVRRSRAGLVLEVRAPSFVWGMVRKIVGSLREVAEGRLGVDRLQDALAGRTRLTLPLAEAEGLVLWEVQFRGVRWEAHWPGPNRYQRRYAEAAREELATRAAILGGLFGRGVLRARS
jgi:tRNA pseudouridine38-40 synthase